MGFPSDHGQYSGKGEVREGSRKYVAVTWNHK